MTDTAIPPNVPSYTDSSSEDSIAARIAAYAAETVDLFARHFTDIIRIREPRFEAIFKGERSVPSGDRALLLRTLQAYGIWFQLLSIAEENAGMRRRRLIEKERGPDQVAGTFAHVFSAASAMGIPTEEISDLLQHSRIRPVITAHPTEAKRVTVLEIHRRIYVLLMQIESERWTLRERQAFVDALSNEIDLLWLTGELRLEKPTVDQEVAWGLHFFTESLFERVPELLDKVELAVEQFYPNKDVMISPFFQFDSWIGGDRDGNPFVTTEITRRTLFRYRRASLFRYRARLEELCRKLSVAEHSVDIPGGFRGALSDMLEQSGEGKSIGRRNPGEVFRQYAACIQKKLAGTLTAAEQGVTVPRNAFAYQTADELIDDLNTVIDGLAGAKCGSLAHNMVLPLRREVETFRFRTVSLDLRENTTVTNESLAAIWYQITGGDEGQRPAQDSAEWKAWVISELVKPLGGERIFTGLPERAQSTFDLLRMVRQTRDALDREAFGAFVLSMTQSAADVLSVYLLAKYAGLFADPKGVQSCTLMVVPLFETIGDLRAAPAIVRELLSFPIVRRTVQELSGVQEVMIGYSDSNKDGGFLCSNWQLSQAQSRLSQLRQETGIPIAFFHGRGGSVSRGGAPTGHAIAAQPAGSISGRMRITEQGEVVSFKFANRGTALYYMELLAASVFEHTLKSGREQALKPHREFDEAMEALADMSYIAYRCLAEHPGLVTYYRAASPVEELAMLNIGSRPARRFGAKSLSDLRAIPWVFAWTQNRHLIPGWYSVGSAIEEFVGACGRDGESLLKRMFDQSRLFRLVIDETEKTLAQVDLAIARAYAELVPDNDVRHQIFTMIEQEHLRTLKKVLWLSGSKELLDRFPRFKRRLSRRLTGINQVNKEQVKLLRAFRNRNKHDKSRQEDLISLLLSINCIATGLGSTG